MRNNTHDEDGCNDGLMLNTERQPTQAAAPSASMSYTAASNDIISSRVTETEATLQNRVDTPEPATVSARPQQLRPRIMMRRLGPRDSVHLETVETDLLACVVEIETLPTGNFSAERSCRKRTRKMKEQPAKKAKPGYPTVEVKHLALVRSFVAELISSLCVAGQRQWCAPCQWNGALHRFCCDT